ncbi:AAA family ATPase [Pelagovum pacificum]|uniref:Nucleoside kinase n=1 Tax=Pelagovum pacificum TaxID=2588711 RepID=A0A5C5GHU0_9RHOB|nr:nucleoside kinase [Pelagovum pacificum]QQA43411.1 hypothetical protein I8N54_02220 [Pelagovum pacificum]TNY33451.1 nucleoside kinase [Pelagovum pacificum]
MGVRNYLVEGVSGTGKTSVCDELQRRGYHAIHGDRELAYQGDPMTGTPLTDRALHGHEHHIWDIAKLDILLADMRHPATFFCGGSRNFAQFIDRFDAVFVLDIDAATLEARLDGRPDEYGATGEERALVRRLHATGEGLPPGATRIDATGPLADVADRILAACGSPPPG